MIHLERLLCDIILSSIETTEQAINWLKRVKPKQSLIADNIFWCTNAGWMDRLVAYKQLELWTADK